MERIALTPDLNLSRIVYGTWRLADDGVPDTKEVLARFHSCLEQGITSFDQADIYGDYTCEALTGQALRAEPELRERMEIITKCDIVAPVGRYAHHRVKHYNTSRAHIHASVEMSRSNLHCDVIDLLLLHRPDPLMNPDETGAALDELVESGKVRAVGVSNFRPHDWELLQASMQTPLCTNQIEVSLLHHSPLTNGDLAFLQQRKVAPMAWSPLGGGGLFAAEYRELRAVLERVGAAYGVNDSAVAVAWLLAHPARIMPVMGTNTPKRIAALSDACKVTLDRESWFEIYTAALGEEVP